MFENEYHNKGCCWFLQFDVEKKYYYHYHHYIFLKLSNSKILQYLILFNILLYC